MTVLERITAPQDLRHLTDDERVVLCAEIRDLLVQTVSRTGGHLGPNLGVVELTVALHTVFESPTEPILFDTGHQAYVHKMLTGRRAGFDQLRQTDGMSGYPSRSESPHDWIENSHASTALSWADGMAKGYEVRGERRPVVAVVGDGALTGGMCWEALNNIAGADRPVIIVVNDNGRSYSPTTGGLAEHLAGLRLRPGYERMLDTVRGALERTPMLGQPIFDALHGFKRGVKDLLAPQGMFEDLGLKYLGPVDGHDLGALHHALTLARNFGGPVIVHAVTRKGYGYAPAENDVVEQMHSPGAFDPLTGLLLPREGRRWTSVFGEELVDIAGRRGDVVAISAAMVDPTGLGEFARRFPDRLYDVGIAEQHALTSAAGLASAGMHPVVALYATFLNRAFDQLLMDVALHRLAVTVVLDRAGVTGDDGASHNGMWDLAMLGMVPGLRLAAPRDEATLRTALREALDHADGPTVVRFPKTPLGPDLPVRRRSGGVDILAESAAESGSEHGADASSAGAAGSVDTEPNGPTAVDVLLVAVGATASDVLVAVQRLAGAGFTYRVVAATWVMPIPPEILDLAAAARLVVSVEDGIVVGGVGSRLAAAISDAGLAVATRQIGIPAEFLDHGKVVDVKARIGMTAQDIGRRVVEWAASLPGQDPGPARAERADAERADPA